MEDNQQSDAPLITFGTKPINMGELEMALKMGTGDVSATIDLLVSRSEPKVTREYVCTLTPAQVTALMPELQKSIETATYIENLFRNIGGM